MNIEIQQIVDKAIEQITSVISEGDHTAIAKVEMSSDVQDELNGSIVKSKDALEGRGAKRFCGYPVVINDNFGKKYIRVVTR